MVRLHILGKTKLSSNICIVTAKGNIKLPEEEIRSFFRNLFAVTTALMLTQCEMHVHLKDREVFPQHRFKVCYPLVLMKKKHNFES